MIEVRLRDNETLTFEGASTWERTINGTLLLLDDDEIIAEIDRGCVLYVAKVFNAPSTLTAAQAAASDAKWEAFWPTPTYGCRCGDVCACSSLPTS